MSIFSKPKQSRMVVVQEAQLTVEMREIMQAIVTKQNEVDDIERKAESANSKDQVKLEKEHNKLNKQLFDLKQEEEVIKAHQERFLGVPGFSQDIALIVGTHVVHRTTVTG